MVADQEIGRRGTRQALRAAMARAAGLDVVMDRCMKIEHARFFGSNPRA
jgi:predicted CoA-binding protein